MKPERWKFTEVVIECAAGHRFNADAAEANHTVELPPTAARTAVVLWLPAKCPLCVADALVEAPKTAQLPPARHLRVVR